MLPTKKKSPSRLFLNIHYFLAPNLKIGFNPANAVAIAPLIAKISFVAFGIRITQIVAMSIFVKIPRSAMKYTVVLAFSLIRGSYSVFAIF